MKNVSKQQPMVNPPPAAPHVPSAGADAVAATMDGKDMMKRMEDMMRHMAVNMAQMESMVVSVKTHLQAAAVPLPQDVVDAPMGAVAPENLDAKLNGAAETATDDETKQDGVRRGTSRTPRRAWHGSLQELVVQSKHELLAAQSAAISA